MCAAGVAAGAGACYRAMRGLFVTDRFCELETNSVDPLHWYKNADSNASLEIAISVNENCNYVSSFADDIASLTTPAFAGGGVYIDVPYKDSIIAVRLWSLFWEWLLKLSGRKFASDVLVEERAALYEALVRGAVLHVSFCWKKENSRDQLGVTVVGLPPALLHDFAQHVRNSCSFGSGSVKLLDFRDDRISVL